MPLPSRKLNFLLQELNTTDTLAADTCSQQGCFDLFSIDSLQTNRLHVSQPISHNCLTIMSVIGKEKKQQEQPTKESEKEQDEFVEPLLRPNPLRFVLFPIQHVQIYDFFKRHQASIWSTEEIDLGGDLSHWQEKLNDGERYFIKMVLAFFASSDGIVSENLASRFMREVQLPEARAFYAVQVYMETIHGETYSTLIDTYIRDAQEKAQLFAAIDNFESIGRKARWALNWIESEDKASFAERLVAFAVVEGLFFSGAFCSIFWLKKRGLMPGLCFSNEVISRDEGLHVEFACLLYKMLVRPLSPSRVLEIVTEAVEIEKAFICDALPLALIGINAELMSLYIEFVADHLLRNLGYPKHYNTPNPFPWMTMISLAGKTNFFERRVAEYATSSSQGLGADGLSTTATSMPLEQKESCVEPKTTALTRTTALKFDVDF